MDDYSFACFGRSKFKVTDRVCYIKKQESPGRNSCF